MSGTVTPVIYQSHLHTQIAEGKEPESQHKVKENWNYFKSLFCQIKAWNKLRYVSVWMMWWE